MPRKFYVAMPSGKKKNLLHQTGIVTYYWTSASLDYMTDYEKNCQKITREDIKRFVNKYITGKPYIAGMVINPEMNKKLNASENFKPSFY